MKGVGKMKVELFSYLFEQHKIPEIYSKIYYGQQVVCNTDVTTESKRATLHSFRLVPGYMRLELRTPGDFVVNTIKQFNWGYAIFLESVLNPELYIKNQFGSNAKNIRRYINRLESCFNVTYCMYYGQIEYDRYSYIMEALKSMLVRRFQQRNEEHKELGRWEALCKTTYAQIIAKEASLFVIYDQDKPIEISLNYHFDQILFSSISSYDIDYSKFGLGHVEIYKQLEWCLENQITAFEMGVGGMDYKRRWCNTIYNFEHHIVFSGKSIFTQLPGIMETLKIKLKEYLKSQDIPGYYHKLKTSLRHKKREEKEPKLLDHSRNYELELIPHFETPEKANLIVFYNLEPGSVLRKIICDYLFTNTEFVGDLQVLEIEKEHVYVLKGKKSSHKLVISGPF